MFTQSFKFYTFQFHILKSADIEKAETVAQRCSLKKVFLEISQYSQENTCTGVSFLLKLLGCNVIKKETPAQVFSCEFFEISKNTFFTEHLRWLLLKKVTHQTDRIWTVAPFSKFYVKNLTLFLS